MVGVNFAGIHMPMPLPVEGTIMHALLRKRIADKLKHALYIDEVIKAVD